MKHAYLTKKEINKAKEMKQITASEEKELSKRLKFHSKSKKNKLSYII